MRARRTRAGAAALFLAGSFAPEALAGAEPAQDEDSPIETVLVSAEKRATAVSAQSVPIALTALDGSTLDDLHATNLTHLATVAPNVTFDDAGVIKGFANFTIRGLGVNTTIPSVEPAVGVFLDGIYLGQPAGSVPDLFDVGDVEILRGPQSTLFGRNTTGGAVLINTRRPGDTFAVHGQASIESGLEEKVGLSIEGPIGNGLKAKIAGYYDNDAGWFTNSYNGKSFGEDRSGFVRPMVVWSPSETFDTMFIYQHGWSNGQGAPVQNSNAASGFHLNIDYPGFHKIEQDAVTLESNLHVASGLVTNLFGYRRLDQEGADDIDGQPTLRFDGYSNLHQHQFSDELRYAARYFDRLDLTAGFYFFTQQLSYFERRVLNRGAIDSTMGAILDDTNYAAFAEADYYLTPELALIAGGRLTREEKSAKVATFIPSTARSLCNYATETCTFNFPGPAFPDAPGNGTWDNFAPKFGATFQPEDNLFLYAHWARGVRSGGYNARNSSSTIPPGPYDPETQDAYEIGFKSDWLMRRLRLNGAAFYNTIRSMQRDVTVPDPIAGFVQVTRNTADATIAGFETEATAAVTDGLVLNANVGYLDGHYNKIYFDLDGGGIGPSDLGLHIPRLSKWGYSLGAAYTRDLGAGYALDLRADYGYRSRAALTDDNTAFLRPVKNLTASASLALPDGHWSLSIYGRNLLNAVTEGIVSAFPPMLGGGLFRTLNEGRVIGAQAAFTY